MRPDGKYQKLSAKDFAFVMVAQKFNSHQEWQCLMQLWTKESNWRSTADNPKSSAFGIPQFLDQTWINYGYPVRPKDPHIQVEAGLKYIKARYQTPCGAWKFWSKKGWY